MQGVEDEGTGSVADFRIEASPSPDTGREPALGGPGGGSGPKVEVSCREKRGWEGGYGKLRSNEGLARYKMREHPECDGCRLLKGRAGVLEDGLHIIMRIAPRAHSAGMGWLYRRLRMHTRSDLCECAVKKLLKDVSGEAKREGTYAHPSWRYFTHWDLMFGYVGYAPEGALEEEVKAWLVTPRHIGEALIESRYLGMLYTAARSFFREEWTLPQSLPTIEEWVAAGRWMRGKAGTGGSTFIRIQGALRKTRAYKGVDAALKTDEEIALELTAPMEETMAIDEKSFENLKDDDILLKAALLLIKSVLKAEKKKLPDNVTAKNLEEREISVQDLQHYFTLIAVKTAKSRWKQLRNNHRDALKRQNATRSGQARKQRKEWKYQKAMSFLLPYMSNRDRPTNFAPLNVSVMETSNSPNTIEESSRESYSLLPSNSNNLPSIDDPNDSTASGPHPSTSKKRKKDEILELLKKNQERCELLARERIEVKNMMLASDKYDNIDLFFLNLAASTKKLPYHLQLQIKKTCFNAVMSAEESNLQHSWYSPNNYGYSTGSTPTPDNINTSIDTPSAPNDINTSIDTPSAPNDINTSINIPSALDTINTSINNPSALQIQTIQDIETSAAEPTGPNENADNFETDYDF
ncbi:unnamed protein product [Parnassius apollo]|uniref:(apollo) hypothetical protein n=1 Tax=Parnassius apollo TaxID=110799 RepID=A0A8S3WCP2_PARAO|nr:unnamed protein product [Parnassius apollo]